MSNYAVVLAGGIGKRMGDVKLPKQFLEIANTPIIILTIKHILDTGLFDFILVVTHEDWMEYLEELLLNSSIKNDNIKLIRGGMERIDSIENAVDYLKKENVKDDDVVVFCDAVRPFVTKKILTDAVYKTKEYGATVAVCPVKDTMIISENKVAIDMPDRKKLFHGQAPDSFQFGIIHNAIKSLSLSDRTKITGTAQICQINNIVVHTIEGDEKNIKITTIMDLFLANAIYKEMYV